MARLAHPNVVTVHDVGVHGEGLFLAMEFVEGHTLREWLSAESRPWRAILAMFRQAAAGLAAAHEAGIYLARALMADPLTRPRATELSRAALDALRAAGEAEQSAKIEAWLAEQGAPSN
jgi:serine/threonine protein kinase